MLPVVGAAGDDEAPLGPDDLVAHLELGHEQRGPDLARVEVTVPTVGHVTGKRAPDVGPVGAVVVLDCTDPSRAPPPGRVVVHPVGRVSDHEVRHLGSQQRRDVLRRFPAHEPVRAELVDLSRPDGGLARGRAGLVGVRCAQLDDRLAQLLQHLLQPGVLGADALQQAREQRVVATRHGGERVIGGEHLVRLLLGEVRDEDRHDLAGQGLAPQVPVDQQDLAAGPQARQEGPGETNVSQEAPEGGLLLCVVRAPVSGVRHQLPDGDAAEFDDAVT